MVPAGPGFKSSPAVACRGSVGVPSHRVRPSISYPAHAASHTRPAAPLRRQPTPPSPGAACCRPARPASRVAAAAAPAAQSPNGIGNVKLEMPGKECAQINMVMKFGGSSVASAERMWEVAQIVCSFPQYFPCVVLSAMGKTTNLLLEAGEQALSTPPGSIALLAPLRAIKELHRETADRLRVDAAARDEVESLLTQLQQLLVGISIMQDLTPRARDSLVSYGERLSTRLFAAFLRAHGVPAVQHDAMTIGVTTSDDFTNADVQYELTLPAVREALTLPAHPRALPIVTGFLGKGLQTGAVTTLGRGGSDLTCTLLGAALRLEEVQVWKDVSGVLTSDPRVVDCARPVPRLTFEEATELAFFGATVLHPQAMQPAVEAGGMGVRVKNSFDRAAPGTLIVAERDNAAEVVAAVVLKQHVTLVDISSTRMLGQWGFLARVFGVFDAQKLSVDVVATSEVSVSLTLDPAKTLWERDLIEEELESLMCAFEGWATASYRRGMSIVSLICNVRRTSEVLERAFRVLGREGIVVGMMSMGASKVNISLVMPDADGQHAVRCLHAEFFGST